MSKLLAWLFLAAIVLGIAGLAVTTERSSAQLPDGRRFDLDCHQTQAPNFNAVTSLPGIVECTLTIDIPEVATPPLPDTITLTIVATYNDRDKSGGPSPGDRLKCLEWSVPGGQSRSFCRPGVPPPTPTPP